jgi:ZIP family zinc transporter
VLTSGIAPFIRDAGLRSDSVALVGFITSTATGAIFALLADTMILEAFKEH